MGWGLIKVGVHNIEKKKGDVNVNMQTKVGVGVRLRLGLGFGFIKVGLR